jgi:hypothetical protein
MAGEASEQTVDWLVLFCPSCGGKCRARARSARKPLRCPRCGAVIRPSAGEPQPASTEPVGPSRSKQAAPTVADDESDEAAYTAGEPEDVSSNELPEPDPIEDVELRRQRPPAPVAPLWSGVYGFPWHESGLRPWFLFGIGLSLVALLGAGMHYVIDLYMASGPEGGIWIRVMFLYIKGFGLFLLWTGTFAGTFFLATIQDTAAGSYKVRKPDDSIAGQFFTFFYLAWIFFYAALPFGLAATLLQPLLGFNVTLWSLIPTTIVVFPIVLLSVMANDSFWMFLNKDVIQGLLLRPYVLLVLYLMSTLLLAPCVALGYLTIGHYGQFIFLAPVTGFVWSACLLIYGRLLGRVAWSITGEDKRAKWEARRKRRRSRPDSPGYR